MNNKLNTSLETRQTRARDGHLRWAIIALITAVAPFGVGCHSSTPEKQNKDFFTSGSREADQRASQRMARDEQLAGTGENSGEKGVKKAAVANPKPASTAVPEAVGGVGGNSGTNKAAQAEGKLALYDRLGGEEGLNKLIDDFTPRVLQDPRVNWDRTGVTKGGLSFSRDESVAWKPTPENVNILKKHLVEFLALATGGPSHYEGKDIKSVHGDMHIANPEFDAVVGDLKVSLDRLKIPNTEQKELLAIVESTRPQIVTKK